MPYTGLQAFLSFPCPPPTPSARIRTPFSSLRLLPDFRKWKLRALGSSHLAPPRLPGGRGQWEPGAPPEGPGSQAASTPDLEGLSSTQSGGNSGPWGHRPLCPPVYTQQTPPTARSVAVGSGRCGVELRFVPTGRALAGVLPGPQSIPNS